MTITNLMNRPVQIVRRGPSGTTDDYGNEIPGETVVSTVCEFQNQRGRSDAEDGSHNELAESRWDVFLPADTDITSGDALIVDGLEYEVDGEAWPVRNPLTQTMSHVEVTVKRVAGSGDGEDGS